MHKQFQKYVQYLDNIPLKNITRCAARYVKKLELWLQLFPTEKPIRNCSGSKLVSIPWSNDLAFQMFEYLAPLIHQFMSLKC